VKKTVGNRIRKIRLSQSFTQENVAAELGIEPGTYAKIERGETDVQVTRLYEIAKILKVNVMEFLQDRKEPSFEDPLKHYGFATKHDIDQLTHVIQKLSVEVEKLKNKMEGQKKQPLKKKK
jgi:transcriptional regulator with XRE-family HTH domain